ncbi:MAG: transcriptional regulator [Candidatus Aminicenantales bacterium]
MVMAFLRFVLFAFVAYVAFLFLRIFLGLKQRRPQTRTQTPREVQGVMVKDEVCGTYVPRDEALTEVRDGVEHFFCSEECRRKLKAR